MPRLTLGLRHSDKLLIAIAVVLRIHPRPRHLDLCGYAPDLGTVTHALRSCLARPQPEPTQQAPYTIVHIFQ